MKVRCRDDGTIYEFTPGKVPADCCPECGEINYDIVRTDVKGNENG
jgi:hypothetical protein